MINVIFLAPSKKEVIYVYVFIYVGWPDSISDNVIENGKHFEIRSIISQVRWAAYIKCWVIDFLLEW